MRVVVDRDRCQGHGLCALFGPEVFSLDESGFAAVSEPTVPTGTEETVRRVAANCPERAILIVEDERRGAPDE